MADNTIKTQGLPSTIPSDLLASSQQTSAPKATKELGETEFLNLLVNQLQNQDPLNPMDSQQFAAQLAQFSSLEQLININKKLDGGAAGGGDVGQMAAFLGQEVQFGDGTATVAGGKGPNVLLDMPAGAQSARLDLVGADGKIAGSVNVAGQDGRTVVSLDGAEVPDGTYSIQAKAVNAEGRFVDLDAKVTGTVDGFVLQPEPALIVNGAQIKMEDVKGVFASKA